MTRPVAVAITGGIGAGKSEALAAFARHGAATVSADEIVHHLLATDDDVRAALVERFGERILGDDGRPDRKRIGEIVFADPDALVWLEQLLHPLVSQTYMDWREALGGLDAPPAVCVTEVPLLFEVGSEQRFDRVVVVTAPQPLRAERRRVPHDDRDERLLPDAEKVARADYAYVNDGSLDDLDAFVAGVMHDLVQ
ncbi:MAG: dephospho-CoA kinase [Gaiellaceae bacterium]